MKYIVTGGGGFLGKKLCLRLLADGHEVWSLSRGSYPDLEQAGVRTVQADISRPLTEQRHVFEGCAAVFHTAAKVDMWGASGEFFKVNVLGTRHVIEACRNANVRRLIYTSSPSVVADGRDLEGIDESYPYPGRYLAAYPRTKARAELEVLEANGDVLHTISLRPHLIWGPGDTNFVPTILERAREGRLLQIGPGENLVDLSYIDDCVEAHICAMQALDSNPDCRGKAYFISQGEPVKMWAWINEVLRLNGLPQLSRRMPAWAGSVAASVCEFLARVLPGSKEPLLTRFLVCEMLTHHYFNIAAAKRDLGFTPKYSIAQAMALTFGKQSAVGA